MKKAIKITTYCLVVSTIIALGLCYLIIPERTKSAMDIVIEYLNKPLGIVFGTTITLGLVVGIVLKLVWDRHRDSVRKDISEYKTIIENEQHKLESTKQELSLKESEIKAYLGSYKEYTDKLTELVIKACETSPNAKINKYNINKLLSYSAITCLKSTTQNAKTIITTNIKNAF